MTVAQANADNPSAAEPFAEYTWTQFIISSVLLAVAVVCAVMSVILSFRYRRTEDGALRGLHQARMNISMGIMLIAIALIQILMFNANWLRAIIGAVFLLMGLFNLFAGLRNRRMFLDILAKRNNP
jgi:heme/copper-type cytochrome/quinol oxidase subunit 2